jgi:NO-binding membrane sensor protein with MHYT domain
MMDAMAGEVLRGWYDYRLVALSVVIAVLASYVALDLAGRVTNAQGRTKTVWLCGGATAMGSGIWSMHYVGMLAFRLPVPVLYDWPTVGVSLLAAILASAIALFVVSRKKMGIAAALTEACAWVRRLRGCTTSEWRRCGCRLCATTRRGS